MLCSRWTPVSCLVVVIFLSLQQCIYGAVQGFNDTQIEGADPCISGNDPVYGSNYQVVASKPSSQSDFAVSQDPSVNCQQPIQVCGPVTFVERECRQTAGCTAFSYDGSCGYLKTADQPRVTRGGWITYVLR